MNSKGLYRHVHCLYCNGVLHPDAKNCQHCNENVVANQKECPFCYFSIDKRALVCGYCGNALSTDPQLNEFRQIEIEKVFDGFLAIQSLRIQVAVFFATVNLTGLTIALSSKLAGIVFISALLMFACLVVDTAARTVIYNLFLRSLELEKKYAPNDGVTFLTVMSRNSSTMIDRALNMNENDRFAYLSRPRIVSIRSRSVVLPLIAIVAEVVLGLYLMLVNDWGLF